eukprot:4742075-Pleurochrysis_carterae.AAC.1
MDATAREGCAAREVYGMGGQRAPVEQVRPVHVALHNVGLVRVDIGERARELDVLRTHVRGGGGAAKEGARAADFRRANPSGLCNRAHARVGRARLGGAKRTNVSRLAASKNAGNTASLKTQLWEFSQTRNLQQLAMLTGTPYSVRR